MQYHVSNYGVFSLLCPQVFALPEDVSLLDGAFNVVNKSIFTLGVNGQANTVKGIREGKRYASNLKWAYANNPATDVQFFNGSELADGCSRGNTDSNLTWPNLNTVFIDDENPATIWSYGKVAVGTGALSPRLSITCFLYNGTISKTATHVGRVSFNSYAVTSDPFDFKYARHILTSVDASSYSYRVLEGISDMIMFCDSDLPDQVNTVAKYECVAGNRLFRFAPGELDFGPLTAGTRPKIQTYLTASYHL